MKNRNSVGHQPWSGRLDIPTEDISIFTIKNLRKVHLYSELDKEIWPGIPRYSMIFMEFRPDDGDLGHLSKKDCKSDCSEANAMAHLYRRFLFSFTKFWCSETVTQRRSWGGKSLFRWKETEDEVSDVCEVSEYGGRLIQTLYVFGQLSNQTLGCFGTSFAVQNTFKLGWRFETFC